METIKERLEAPMAKFQMIEKRIEAIPDEITAIEKRIMEVTVDLNRILGSIEEERKQRRRLLVSGGKVEEATRKIKEFWEKCDLAEDQILGLKEKAKDLHAEKEDLLKQKDTVRDEIIKMRLVPLVEAYNKHAELLSDTLKKILSLMDASGLPFGDSENGWGRFISSSSWRALRVVPRLFWQKEGEGDDFFNITKISEARQQEQIKSLEKRRGNREMQDSV